MGRIVKRGNTYWADFQTREGKRVRKSLRTRDPKVARDRLRDAELAPADRPEDAPPRLLGDALDYLLAVGCNDLAPATRGFYTQKAQHLLRLLGNVPIDGDNALDRTRVAKYARTRIDEGASANTVSKELITLRRALKEQHDIAPLPRPPGDVIPKWSAKYTPVRRFLSPDEFAALLEAFGEIKRKGVGLRRRFWCVFVVYTGANLGETQRVLISGVNLEQRQIHIPGTKRQSRDRFVPIPDPLVPWLAAELARRRTAVELAGRRAGEAPVEPLLLGAWSNVRNDLARACHRAGVPRVTPNDLRRTYASWLKQAGVDSRAVADLMGHSSTRMVDQVYGRLTPAVYQRAVASLPAIATRQLQLPGPIRAELERARREKACAAIGAALLTTHESRRSDVAPADATTDVEE